MWQRKKKDKLVVSRLPVLYLRHPYHSFRFMAPKCMHVNKLSFYLFLCCLPEPAFWSVSCQPHERWSSSSNGPNSPSHICDITALEPEAPRVNLSGVYYISKCQQVSDQT